MNKNVQQILNRINGKLSLAEKFHNATQNKKLNISIPVDKIPESWRTIHFKTYPRLKSFTIDKKKNKYSLLAKIINNRVSIRAFSDKVISYDIFFHVMKNAAGITHFEKNIDDSRRFYPSAGARYPLELYAVVMKVDGLNKGLYHYNVKHNVIELLLEQDLWPQVLEIFGGETSLKHAAVVFLITGVLGRTLVKYSDRGYRYMLIESGHLAQNIYLLATEVGLGVCSYGGFIEEKVIELLDIYMQKELPLYALSVGSKE